MNRLLWSKLIAGIGCLLLAFSLHAHTVKDLKAEGWVGEMKNGYLGFVKTPSDDIKKYVEEVNTKRKQQYTGIASSKGTPLQEVEAIAGNENIASTAKGHYIQNKDGQWEVKK